MDRALAPCVSLFSCVLVALAIGPAPLLAQTKGTSKKAVKSGPVKLDKKALAEKLEKFKREIADKVVSERIRKSGPRRVEKWMKTFQVVQSKHYLVYTNGPKTTSQRFAGSLEQLYAYVKKLWPFDDLDHHLTAYIFQQTEEYISFCVQVTGWSEAAARGTAGHATGAYYATYYQSPKSDVVMHEATHQIVHACLKIPGVGSWFQEGMAVFIEKEILGAKVSGGMRADLRNGTFYSMRDFVAISTLLSDPKGHGSRNYDHAGCIIEFMMRTKDPRMKGKFRDFLGAASRNYRRGPDASEHLFKTTYGMSLDEVQAAFGAFHRVKNPKPGQKNK